MTTEFPGCVGTLTLDGLEQHVCFQEWDVYQCRPEHTPAFRLTTNRVYHFKPCNKVNQGLALAVLESLYGMLMS